MMRTSSSSTPLTTLDHTDPPPHNPLHHVQPMDAIVEGIESGLEEIISPNADPDFPVTGLSVAEYETPATTTA